MLNTIVNAIRNRQVLTFTYSGLVRVVEPHEHSPTRGLFGWWSRTPSVCRLQEMTSCAVIKQRAVTLPRGMSGTFASFQKFGVCNLQGRNSPVIARGISEMIGA